jgi:hypothetical protein
VGEHLIAARLANFGKYIFKDNSCVSASAEVFKQPLLSICKGLR